MGGASAGRVGSGENNTIDKNNNIIKHFSEPEALIGRDDVIH